ncbi:hypothetical protein TNCV_996351 [Trichonephila clavipes]|nr:hypothetical protein TNCV_996351 [Trichonephila clavipes]
MQCKDCLKFKPLTPKHVIECPDFTTRVLKLDLTPLMDPLQEILYRHDTPVLAASIVDTFGGIYSFFNTFLSQIHGHKNNKYQNFVGLSVYFINALVIHWCAKIKDEVEKLAYQLNEEAEWTERPIRSLSKVMYGSMHRYAGRRNERVSE